MELGVCGAYSVRCRASLHHVGVFQKIEPYPLSLYEGSYHIGSIVRAPECWKLPCGHCIISTKILGAMRLLAGVGEGSGVRQRLRRPASLKHVGLGGASVGPHAWGWNSGHILLVFVVLLLLSHAMPS